MGEALILQLLKSFVLSWAKAQGANKLRRMAATPERDIHVSWRAVKFVYDVYVFNGGNPPLAGAKRFASVTVGGERFDLWYRKTQNVMEW